MAQLDPSAIEEYRLQEALQGQQMSNQYSMQAPYMFNSVQEHQAILVEQTNPDKIIEAVILKLMGYEKRYDGSVKKVRPPTMNELGIARMSFIMSSIINQNTILSHLEDQEISKLIIQLGDDLIDDLTLNWKDYAIEDKILLDHIVDAIVIPSYLALKRALGQNEKNWLGKISVENITNAPRIGQPKKEGFWSKLKL